MCCSSSRCICRRCGSSKVCAALPHSPSPPRRPRPCPHRTPQTPIAGPGRSWGVWQGELARATREPLAVPRGGPSSWGEHGISSHGGEWTRAHGEQHPPYPKPRRGQRQGVAQRPGASAARGYLHIPMAGLCYDTQHVEAMPFPVAMPDTLPCALSSDFSQEKLLSTPLVERLRRKNLPSRGMYPGKSLLQPLLGAKGAGKPQASAVGEEDISHEHI